MTSHGYRNHRVFLFKWSRTGMAFCRWRKSGHAPLILPPNERIFWLQDFVLLPKTKLFTGSQNCQSLAEKEKPEPSVKSDECYFKFLKLGLLLGMKSNYFFFTRCGQFLFFFFWGGGGGGWGCSFDRSGVPRVDREEVGTIHQRATKKITQNILHSIKQNNKEADQNLNFPCID